MGWTPHVGKVMESVNLKERGHVGYLDVNGRVILKIYLKGVLGCYGTDWNFKLPRIVSSDGFHER
jgi:hypothetical protein